MYVFYMLQVKYEASSMSPTKYKYLLNKTILLDFLYNLSTGHSKNDDHYISPSALQYFI